MGVIGFLRVLANDVAKNAITVNAILPSITKTPGTNFAAAFNNIMDVLPWA
jgi:NAD(P)-dependent dehydrogenase (short-subunit alcohol dehydrogenase family)